MMMIPPPQGLVDIERSRRREEALASMMDRVKTTQNAMERIYWEKKTEHRHGDPMCHHHYQRRGTGVKDSMTCHDNQCDQGKFIRCSISEVVNDIKSEDNEKANKLLERRETARRNIQRREDEERNMTEEEKLSKKALRERHVVKSIDTLGMTDCDYHYTSARRIEIKKKQNGHQDDEMTLPWNSATQSSSTLSKPSQIHSVVSDTLQYIHTHNERMN